MKASDQRDRFLIDEMLNHADVIAVNVRKGRDVFDTDTTTRYAVEHATELFAEAAEKISRPFKSANRQVPWARLRELRHDVAHPYDTGANPTSVEQTWRFARDDVPKITRKLRHARFPRIAEPARE
ncbi:MAG: DUF86 domain-containing protein [Thermoplasmata archaeon]|nr:DUF86 domain-containing protein [Thermoplasmata archaeon]